MKQLKKHIDWIHVVSSLKHSELRMIHNNTTLCIYVNTIFVNVVDSRCIGDNFNQLRRYLFHQPKGSSLQNLPPTGQGLLPHLQRAHYNTHITIHILDRQLCITSVPIDPINNGFTNTNGNLLPKTAWKLLENCLNVVCDCKKCARETCPCRTEKFRCSKFCKCSISKGCKNPYK